MLDYLLKSSACLAIFLLFYKLLLEGQSMHLFKRFYLLASIVIAFAIPFITFTQYVDAVPLAHATPMVLQETPIENIEAVQETPIVNLSNILWSIYLLGVILFGIHFFKNLTQIFNRIYRNPKYRTNNSIKVLLQDHIVPHTFFKYIFLNKQKFETRQIPQEVLTHEEAHAKQNHSLDVVCIELLQVFLWFNPIIYILKKAIKLNHEFLADQAVLQNNIDPVKYQHILLKYSSKDNQSPPIAIGLANAINYSSIKKRFTVMKTHTSKRSRALRSLLLIPVFSLLLYGFSEREIVQKTTKKTIEGQNILQEKATKKQLAEYNVLAKKYNAMSKNNFHVIAKEVQRLIYIYDLMTDKQKAASEPLPHIPNPPPPPAAPRALKGTKSNAPPPPPHSPEIIEIEKEQQLALEEQVEVMEEQRVEMEKQVEAMEEQEIILEKQLLEKEEQKEVMEEQAEVMVAQEITMEEQIADIIENQEIYDTREKKIATYDTREKKIQLSYIPNPTSSYIPPSPPTPKSPLDHVIEMAKKDALFYYKGKEISSDKAIEILKSNTKINIDTRGSTSKRPIVILSTKPIKIGSVQNSLQIRKSTKLSKMENHKVKSNIKLKKVEMVSMRTRQEVIIDSMKQRLKQGKLNLVTSDSSSDRTQQKKAEEFLRLNQMGARWYYNKQRISSIDAFQILIKNNNIKIEMGKTTSDYSGLVVEYPKPKFLLKS